jgi:SAM-dependent methyltransferase
VTPSSGETPASGDFRRTYRVRIALFLLFVAGAAVFLSTGFRTINTLRRLKVVESERDRWQRPADVIRALDVREGQSVVDLGSGAGYLALKLSERVGEKGRVVAVDIRRLALVFLRLRAILEKRHNLTIIVGDEDDPHLPAEAADAVLLANTYHELEHRSAILGSVRQALRAGGRLVVVDPCPRASSEGESHHHESPSAAEAQLREAGFEIVSREDDFLEQPGNGTWWLIVARKP